MYFLRRNILSASRLVCNRFVTRHAIKTEKLKFSEIHRSASTVLTDIDGSLKVGDELHGYHLNVIEHVPELCLTAYHLTHMKTGAQHLHISRDDSNNLFSVTFRTTPTDSTGVAHILEHLALCGSKKFPVRDPFMKMLTRSLSTFMNAFTGPDYTMYPFSTQNSKDFYNLLSIYLDAAFHPLLRRLDFLQEGWRLEHSDVNDPKSALNFKGVVYNEMKGVFSSPSSIYARQMINKLFPENTYQHESGGDPLVIPELSYEDLKFFHSLHYHPTNSRFFTYGNFSLANHLEAINEVIDKFELNEKLEKLSFVPIQSPWSEERRIKLACQNDPLAPFSDKQTTASIVYMLESLNDTHTNFALSILGSLLMDGPNSLLYEALIDSGLGADYSPFCGYQNYTKQSLFSIGLQGISQDQVGSVLKAINMALNNAYTDGFPQKRIEAILHRIELSTKHQSSNFGLSLSMYINSAWNHDVDPIKCLKINNHVEVFKKDLEKDPKYLQKLVKKYFLQNRHRLIIEMSPDGEYESKLLSQEQQLLRAKTRSLTESQLESIFQTGLQLLEKQNTQEDVSVLPTLSINDISRTCKKVDIQQVKIGNVPVQYSAQPTNGIVYYNAVIRLTPEQLPKNLLFFLPLFTQVMTKLGAGRHDRKSLDQEIQMRTGGLHTQIHLADHHSYFDQFENGIHMASHCLERNLEHMFQLWREIFRKICFEENKDHLKQLIRISAAELAQSVPDHGHRYAMNRAASFFGGAFKLRELNFGMTSLSSSRFLAASCEKEIDGIIDKLKQIAQIVMSSKTMRCALNAEAATMRSSLIEMENFLQSIPVGNHFMDIDGQSTGPMAMPTLQSSQNEHFVFPFSTNYLARALFCAPFAHADYAKLKIAASLVSAKFLHKEIREKGGAYGGSAKFDSGGVFYMFSYRDPNITETIETFDRAGQWLLRTDNFKKEDIDEAKLQVFQSVDQPIAPSEQGLDFFLANITDEMKKEYRARLLDVSKSDIQEVAQKYLIDGIALQSGVVLLGPKTDLTTSKENWSVKFASE